MSDAVESPQQRRVRASVALARRVAEGAREDFPTTREFLMSIGNVCNVSERTMWTLWASFQRGQSPMPDRRGGDRTSLARTNPRLDTKLYEHVVALCAARHRNGAQVTARWLQQQVHKRAAFHEVPKGDRWMRRWMHAHGFTHTKVDAYESLRRQPHVATRVKHCASNNYGTGVTIYFLAVAPLPSRTCCVVVQDSCCP